MEQVTMDRLAWICPICGTANAPHTDRCGCVADPHGAAITTASGAAKPHAISIAGISSKSPKAKPPYSLEFEEFWTVYPRKKDKASAHRAWRTALRRPQDASVIIAGAMRYRNDPERPADPRFTKYPATWINARGWEDEPGVVAPPSPVAASMQSAEEIAADWQRRRDEEDERIAAYLAEESG